MFHAHRISLLAAVLSIGLLSCDSTPTGPGTFTGHTLEATVNGTAMTFDVGGGTISNPDPSYEPADTAAMIFGSISTGSTRRTLTVFFYTDINRGSFPRTMDEGSVNIVYIENINGVITSYDCSTHRDNCSLTVASSSGGIVTGTFAANLTNRADTTKRVQLTGGAFSVKFE